MIACFAGLGGNGCERPSGGGGSSATTRPTRDVQALRSLPYAGFSEEADEQADGVAFIDRERMSPGLTLLSIHTQSRAELIDEAGTVLRSWQHRPSRNWDNAELLSDGDLLVVGADAGPPGVAGIMDENRYVLRLDWNGNLRWKKRCPAHHDIEQFAPDRLLTLMFERRRIPSIHADVETRDDELVLLSLTGERLDALALFDVLIKNPDMFPLQKNEPVTQGGKTWVDLFHCNAIERMTRANLAARSALSAVDNILVTFRHQDRVAIVNWPRRELVWAWGQGQLDGPHDAQTLENGNILIFDNGLARGWSRVIELDPLQNQIVWEFKTKEPPDFFTKSKGSCQRLPNGNTLICCSDAGRVFEVNRNREIVWDYRSPHKNSAGQRATIFRAKRFTREEIDRIASSATGPASTAP